MITLTVTGHAEPEQSREEIARLLKEYGVGAVCLLRDGSVYAVKDTLRFGYELGDVFGDGYAEDGSYGYEECDIIRVFPPGTRLRVTVEVVE